MQKSQKAARKIVRKTRLFGPLVHGSAVMRACCAAAVPPRTYVS